ncbi:MAG: NUDIX domain-containing protein [Rubricoccaceae bacterium]
MSSDFTERSQDPSEQSPDLTEHALGSVRVYDGALLQVYRDRVRLPSGETSAREWIRHPGAAAVVPLFADRRVMLLRQFRYAPRRLFEEVPAGKLDAHGEDPRDAARRELLEETGLEAAQWTPLGVTYPAIGYSDEVIHLFLAESLRSAAEAAPEPDEFVEPFLIPLAEAAERARQGGFPDAKTCTALLLAEAHVARRSG